MEERKKWFHGMIHFYYFHGLMGLDHSQKKYFQGGERRKYLVFMRKTELLIQKGVHKAAQSVTGVLKGRRVE